MSSSFSSLSPRDIYAQHLSPSSATQHVLSPSAADGHSLPSPSPSGQLTPAHSLGWETGSAGGQERLWETSSAGGHSDRAEGRRLLPGLSSAMVLLGHRLDQERRERSESILALQRDFQAQQRTLGEITELLASGSLEATLRGLRQDVSRQQEHSDLQAAALREGLLELGKQREECARHRGELDALGVRLSELAQPDTAATDATDWMALREAAEGTAEEVNRLWTYYDEQFRDIITAMELERSLRVTEIEELREQIAAAVASAGRDVHGRAAPEPAREARRPALQEVFWRLTCRSARPAAPSSTCCSSGWRRAPRRLGSQHPASEAPAAAGKTLPASEQVLPCGSTT